MTKLLFFDSFLAKVAKNNFGLKPFSNEWKVAIIITAFAKIFTMIAGIYAGYYFLFDTLIKSVPYTIAILSSIFILIVIEVLNNIFLSKFFKFLFRFKTHYLSAITLLITCIFIYSGSFFISTNGLAAKQAQKADKTEVISNNETDLKHSIETRYNGLINDLKSEIATIKNNPRGAGKSLTIYQQNTIQKYNSDILKLLSQKQAEISELKTSTNTEIQTNTLLVNNEAKRFYTLMEIIMLVQLFCNAFLMFSWSKIYNENNKNEALNESVNNTVSNIQSFISQTFKTELSNQQTILANALNYANMQSIKQPTEPAQPTIKNKPVFGFMKPKAEPLNDAEPLNSVLPLNGERLTVDNLSPKKQASNKHCKHCNTVFSAKHWNAQYCSETCRITAWESRTGAKFTKKATK